jgi:hypothetical protein
MSSNHSFCKCLFFKKKGLKMKMKIEDLRQWEEELIFVERN